MLLSAPERERAGLCTEAGPGQLRRNLLNSSRDPRQTERAADLVVGTEGSPPDRRWWVRSPLSHGEHDRSVPDALCSAARQATSL
jgi:hypothetical protein